ncbi:MAG: hypothetical protein AABO58_13485 [Acidobacteriota bacterium]
MQQLRPEERREFQRLHLTHPIAATLGDMPVKLVEIGILGARLQHSDQTAAEYAELRFNHYANEIGMKCEIVRANLESRHGGLETALRFLAAIGESGDRLRDLLGELVMRELDLRRTHPGTAVEVETVDGDDTVRGTDAGFLCYRFENGVWTRRRVFLPEQPSIGFTVARTEDTAEMQRLCRVFEASDDEGRRLIRLFAELSVSDALEIPPRM